MKVVILAGGLGSRLSEETHKIPKPMVKIGDKPIMSHIINHYIKFGFSEIIVCAGYKKEVIFEHYKNSKNIQIVDTGLNSQSGCRIKRIQKLIAGDENFFMTYGDGLSNINIKKLLAFHNNHNKIATLSAVRPIPRFGHLTIEGDSVVQFKEKDKLSEGWINGGFFVFEPELLNYIKNDNTFLEREPMEQLSKKKQLIAFKHKDFWQCMDTLRDKKILEKEFKKNNF